MTEPKLHLFDMDHTLINTDCDVVWKHYGAKSGIAPANAVELADEYFAQYNAGVLDNDDFAKFQFAEFVGRTMEEMLEHTQQCFEEFVRPKVYKKAKKLIDDLKAKNIPVGILTATNTVIARPLANYFGIDQLHGTELELVDGKFTGRVAEFKVGPGKVPPAENFAKNNNGTLADVAYYGDSINDRYVLDAVGFPVAANPSEELEELAKSKNWKIISFK